MIRFFLLALSLAAGIGFLYWLVILTEGMYLGPRVVAFLYDRGAGTYDRVKQFDPVDDAWDLSVPLQRALEGVTRPLILDVGTGTGRVPRALLRRLDFGGRIVGLDISLEMLREARRKTEGHDDTVTLVWKDAVALPFCDEAFSAVCCIEALEFLARPDTGLKEMVRVLRPGGTLLVSNRIGIDAFLMPGRTFSDRRLNELLASLSLTSVEIKRWQTYYDLVWARKEGTLPAGERSEQLQGVLRCPRCSAVPLGWTAAGLRCEGCGLWYPIEDRILLLERPSERGRHV